MGYIPALELVLHCLRHPNIYACPLSWRGLDREGAAHLCGAFPHGAHTEVPRKEGCWVKAFPIIMYLEDNLVFLPCESQRDGTGTSMLDDVVEGLLRNAVQSVFHLQREIRFVVQG